MAGFRSRLGLKARIALAAAFVVTANAWGYAQSCSLCYAQVAGSGHRFIQGLRTGILVLIVPPMLMSVGITVLTYQKRNRTNERPASERSENDW